MDKSKLGKTLQRHRENAGFSQERLAEAVGVSSNFISSIERGVKLPSLETFVRLANTMNTSTDLLLADVLQTAQKERAIDYLSRIELLPPKSRQHVLAVLETLLTELA